MNARSIDPNEKDCVLLARAVADGRFAEDPGHWAPHLAECEACRKCAEGFALLRGSIERARGTEREGEAAMPDAGQAVAVALVRFRSRQRKRRALVGVGAALVLGLGTFLTLRKEPEPASPFSEDVLAAVRARDLPEPHATALRLHWSIVPRQGGIGYPEILKTNAPLKAAFEAALHHPSAYVRRTALSGLTMGGIEVDQGMLMEVLRTWNEDVETIRASAAAGGRSEASVTAELERGWAQTLQTGLRAAYLSAVARGKHLPTQSIELHLQHPAWEVVRQALDVLRANPAYVPGEAVARLFEDPKVHKEVRAAAGHCWMERLGEGGSERLIRMIESSANDPQLEHELSAALLHEGKAIAWMRRRASAQGTPLLAALGHALGLMKLGERIDVGPLVQRGIESPDLTILHLTAEVCRKADLRAHRKRFQERFLAGHRTWTDPLQESSGGYLLVVLLAWDEATGTEQHLAWGLELCEDDPLVDPRVRGWLERVAGRPEGELARKARRILVK